MTFSELKGIINHMQDRQLLGYEDFLSYYDKVQLILQNRGRNGQETRLFTQYVSLCFSYIRSLSPYELQCLCDALPDIEEKIEIICNLYERIRVAINEAFQEAAPKGPSVS